jgi:hypothetical protein
MGTGRVMYLLTRMDEALCRNEQEKRYTGYLPDQL